MNSRAKYSCLRHLLLSEAWELPGGGSHGKTSGSGFEKIRRDGFENIVGSKIFFGNSCWV